MYGYIYIIENLVNNKKYIGKHKSDNLNDTYMGSGKLIQFAIKKYGLNNFKKTILCQCETLDELNDMEIFYINKYDAVNNSDYYNLKDGGQGGFDYINKNGFGDRTGLKLSQEVRDLISKINSHPLTEVHKQHISDSLINNKSKAGVNNPNFGKVYYTDGVNEVHLTLEQIPQYESMGYYKGRPKSLVDKTCKSKGTVWMNNGIKSVRVKLEYFDSYLQQGFSKGRLVI